MRTFTLFLFCLAVAQVNAQSSCGTALPISAGPVYTVAVINGTPPVLACPPGAYPGEFAVWYEYTPVQDTGLTITTDLPQNTGGDTRFFVYKTSCGVGAICAGSDDDSGSGDLAVTSLNVTGGTTYYIAFDSYWSAAGFDFQLIEMPQMSDYFDFTPVNLIVTSAWPSCVVDMNGDHLDDVLGVTQTTIDVNYQQVGGGFVHVDIPTSFADNDAGWSIAAGDLDGNGYNDLMYGGGYGVTFMMANEGGTGFTENSFPQYVFCQRTNMVDINNDGHLDAFSCHDEASNVYFLNDGNNNFAFHQGGLGEGCGNYGSVWIDIDNDHDMDLFIAKCGCNALDVLCVNQGNGNFADFATPLGFGDYQQSWSSAWGDYDNDGDMDAFVGTSAGDYQKLMRNDGAVFTNVTAGSGFDVFPGSTIEWTTHDFNNDGYLDVLGGGKLMLNNGDMTFTPMTISPYNGPVGDLNNDGFLDIVNGNAAYMNSGNDNHHLTIRTIGTVSNTNGIGARVEITSALGTQIRDVKSGDGFAYMSSLNTYFGLGHDTEVDHVTVYWPSGIVNTVEQPAIDGTLEIVEGVNTSVAGATSSDGLQLFPNPADDVLNIVLPTGITVRSARVLDIAGQSVLEAPVHNGHMEVAALKAGVYVLEVQAGGRLLQRKFTKR